MELNHRNAMQFNALVRWTAIGLVNECVAFGKRDGSCSSGGAAEHDDEKVQ